MMTRPHIQPISMPRKAEVDPQEQYNLVTALRIIIALVAGLKRIF